jgi:NADPH:quinone reductase-like Zn-dependent oxidoreductase
MRAVVWTRRGPPEVLEVQDWGDPHPGEREILIQVAAAAVGFSDLLARVGLYPHAPDPPAVLGYEVAGTVAAVGAGIDDFAAGERVLAFVRSGGYAEQALAQADDVLRLPERMSFEEGAAIPLAFATAYGALFRYGACIRGERVLIQGAAGGVGTAATILARAHGLEIWGTASPTKLGAIGELGVEHPIDHTREGWQRKLPAMDLVMDAIGGKSFKRSYKLLRAGGRLVCYGASDVSTGERRNLLTAIRTLARTPRFGPMKQMRDSRAVIGLDTIAIWDDKGSLGELIQPLKPLLESPEISPAVAETLTFYEAPRAHRMLIAHSNIGKVILRP